MLMIAGLMGVAAGVPAEVFFAIAAIAGFVKLSLPKKV